MLPRYFKTRALRVEFPPLQLWACLPLMSLTSRVVRACTTHSTAQRTEQNTPQCFARVGNMDAGLIMTAIC